MQGLWVRNVEQKGSVSALAASKEIYTGEMVCQLFRDFYITGAATYANSTQPVRVNVYYSPDGVLWDSIPYIYFDLTVSTNSRVQKTISADIPSMGYIRFSVKNLDTSVSASNAEIYVSYARYGEEYLPANQPALTDEIFKQRGTEAPAGKIHKEVI